MNITKEHFETLINDLKIVDGRAFKEVVGFLTIFGEELYDELKKVCGPMKFLDDAWEVAKDLGATYAPKLRAFGLQNHDPRRVNWNELANKYGEGNLRSYVEFLESLLIAYGMAV